MLPNSLIKNHHRNRVCRSIYFFLTTVLALVSGCATLPQDYARTESFAIAQTEDTRLGKTFAPLLSQHPDQSGFYMLPHGTDALAARIAVIAASQRSLDLQYYIWHDDLTGRALQNYLLHAADRGVRVRLLLDDLDTAGKDATLFALNAHPNIEIRVYNPFKHRDMRALDYLTNPARINRRMHNKALIADNQVVILGGRNIGDEYFDASHEVAFGDLDTLAVGPVAQDASASFDRYWNSRWVVPLAAFANGAEVHENAQAFEQRSDAYLLEAEHSAFSEALEHTQLLRYSSVNDLAFAWSSWVLVSDDPGKVEAESVTKETHLAPRLKVAFDRAENDLIIISPYFVPNEAFTDYLAKKIASGVRVRIVTNSLAANDVSIVHAGYMNHREALLKGGVELYEVKAYQDKRVKKARGWSSGSSRSSLHAKSIAFDKTYIFVGSFNLDPRSVALNTELGVYFAGPEFAEPFARQFDERVRETTYRVELIDGKLRWTTVQDGKTLHLDKEPDTSWWKRFSTGFLSIVVPESML